MSDQPRKTAREMTTVEHFQSDYCLLPIETDEPIAGAQATSPPDEPAAARRQPRCPEPVPATLIAQLPPVAGQEGKIA